MNQKSTTEGPIVQGTKTQAYESPTKQRLAHHIIQLKQIFE